MTRPVVAPELRRAARLLPTSAGLARSLKPQRFLFRLLGGLGARRGTEVVRVGPSVSVRVHRPGTGTPGAVLLWLHGGGYVLGTAAQEDVFCRRFAHQSGVTVVAVDYRLAPEHPYPAGLEDAYAALVWLADQPWVDRPRIVVGGASAGGGLAAALGLLARDRGDVAAAGLLLTYPMLDDRTTSSSRTHLMWSAADNVAAWRWYVGDADRSVAVPARRTDLAGLPPTWIGVGTLDLFHAEDVAFAQRLRRAGVEVDLVEVAGAFHGFDQVAASATLAREFLERQRCFTHDVTGPPEASGPN